MHNARVFRLRWQMDLENAQNLYAELCQWTLCALCVCGLCVSVCVCLQRQASLSRGRSEH